MATDSPCGMERLIERNICNGPSGELKDLLRLVTVITGVLDMRIFLITLLLCSITTVAQATILVLGDSLSASYGLEDGKDWVSLLRTAINTRCTQRPDLINASISGERTENAISKLPALLNKYHPSMVLIELGGNDALRGSPISIIRQNMLTLIDMAENAHAKVLLFEMMMLPNFGPAYTKAFNEMYGQLAAEKSVILVPFLLKNVGDHPELMQADGTHPNEAAQKIIFENVWPFVREAIHCHE